MCISYSIWTFLSVPFLLFVLNILLTKTSFKINRKKTIIVSIIVSIVWVLFLYAGQTFSQCVGEVIEYAI